MSITDRTDHCASCVTAIYARESTHRAANLLQEAGAALRMASRGDAQHLAAASDRVAAAALLHRAMLETPPPHSDMTEPLLRVCAAAIAAAGGAGEIDLQFEATPLRADAAAVRPLLMLAAELVGNSARHAFPDARGIVRVTLSDDGCRTTLVVEDDGVCGGWSRSAGHGRSIVDDLTRVLGGIAQRSILPSGSARVSIAIPSVAAAASVPTGSA